METLQLEVEIENQILHDLSDLVDVQVPNIQKLRKQLTSRTLDMDSARARLVVRSSQYRNTDNRYWWISTLVKKVNQSTCIAPCMVYKPP